MKPNPFSLDAKQKSAKEPTAVANLNRSQPAAARSAKAAARRTNVIYAQQGSQSRQVVKHWLEAEAQLFGGVERESQMHPGSSLFKTEH